MRRILTCNTRIMFTRHREEGNFLFCTVLHVCTHRSNSRPPAASECAEYRTRAGSTVSGDTQSQAASKSDKGRRNAASQQSRCALRRHDVAQPKSRAAKARESWCPCCGRKRMHRERSAALDQGQARGCRESAGGWCLPGYYEAQSAPSGRGDADHAEGGEVEPRCRRPLRQSWPSTRRAAPPARRPQLRHAGLERLERLKRPSHLS